MRKKALWILALAGLLALETAVETAGCANSAEDCAALGQPERCTPGMYAGAGGTIGSSSSSGGSSSSGSNSSTGGSGSTAISSSTGGSGSGGADSGTVVPSVCKPKRWGGTLDQTARSLRSDGAGHLLLGGDFQANLSFGQSSLVAGSTSQAFVAVLDARTLNQHQQAVLAQSPGSYLASALDQQGNVIVATSSKLAGCASLDADAGAADAGNTDAGSADAGDPDAGKTFFLTKLDHADGHCILARGFFAQFDRASLAVTPDDHVVLAGAMRSSATSELGQGHLPQYGGLDIAVGVFDGSGFTTRWSHAYGTANDDTVAGVAIAPGTSDLFIAGDFDGTLDFNAGDTPYQSLGREVFVARLSPDGDTLRTDHFRGTSDAVATGIVRLPSGEMIIGGDFKTQITVGNTVLQSQKPSAFFLARLTLKGRPSGATMIDDMGGGSITAIAAGSTDLVALTGKKIVDPSNTKLWLSVRNGKDGSPLFEQTFDGTGLSSGMGVAFDGADLDVAGVFDGKFSFNDSDPTPIVASSPGRDILLLRVTAGACP